MEKFEFETNYRDSITGLECYNVKFDGPVSMTTFIDWLLDRKDEWGCIFINSPRYLKVYSYCTKERIDTNVPMSFYHNRFISSINACKRVTDTDGVMIDYSLRIKITKQRKGIIPFLIFLIFYVLKI